MSEQVANWKLPSPLEFVVDTRPLCGGTPFILTDAAHPRLVLKHAGHFLVLDQAASIPNCNSLGYGYYRHDTRHLSQWEIQVNDVSLSLLSGDISNGYTGTFLYTNPSTGNIPQQKLTVNRQLILDDELWDQLTLDNYGTEDFDVELQMKFQSDFADMFEVRGLNRPRRGERMIPQSSPDRQVLFLAYRGLDNSLIQTVIEFIGLTPDNVVDGVATFKIKLSPRTPVSLEVRILTTWDGQNTASEELRRHAGDARRAADEKYNQWRKAHAEIETDHEILGLAIEQGFKDLYMLRYPTPRGPGIAAGIPWYCTIFGRDSAITGWQMLPFAPQIARECIEVLAAYQGETKDTFKEERPGRIMHELRLGELARTNQIPHSPYYGTADATQLWLLLFCQYIKWTGDLDFAKLLWPRIKLALSWLDRAVSQGNGYITYKRESTLGLDNQGWKDSGDAIVHTDGTLANPPIAVCEVQSYLYAASLSLSEIADLLGYRRLSKKLLTDASELKKRFQQDFWMKAEGYLALALDGDGHPVRTVASNAGHCLFSGILDDDKAQLVADRLMHGDLNSGWGIRTMSGAAKPFSPISYHNGSIWPHDNAIIAEGMRRIGRLNDLETIMQSIIEVGKHYRSYRLPELICGFDKSSAARPVSYPVSCSPQAWASGTLFQMLSSCINFKPDAINSRLSIVAPMLPSGLGNLIIRNIRVGEASLDLLINNQHGSTYCQILRRQGQVKVIIET